MPIPTRTQSVKGRLPRSRNDAETATDNRLAPRSKELVGEEVVQKISIIPKAPASGLPRIAGSHTRTHSVTSTTVNKLADGNKASLLRKPSSGPSSRTHSRAVSTDSRSDRSESYSTTGVACLRTRIGPKSAFNTYQQHYSSRKVSASPAPSLIGKYCRQPKPSEEALSPHLARLQDELLQLSLVHDQSHQTLTQYRDSLYASLQLHFAEVAKEERRIAILEQQQQANDNVHALVQWLGVTDATGPGHDRIRQFSSCLQDLSALTAPGGQFSQLLQHFEQWAIEMQAFLEGKAIGAVNTLGGEASSWQQEASSVSSKLRSYQNLLSNQAVRRPSALADVISTHMQLASAMLEGLDTCIVIRQRLIWQKKVRISDMLNLVISDAQTRHQSEKVTPRQPIWESFAGA